MRQVGTIVFGSFSRCRELLFMPAAGPCLCVSSLFGKTISKSRVTRRSGRIVFSVVGVQCVGGLPAVLSDRCDLGDVAGTSRTVKSEVCRVYCPRLLGIRKTGEQLVGI